MLWVEAKVRVFDYLLILIFSSLFWHRQCCCWSVCNVVQSLTHHSYTSASHVQNVFGNVFPLKFASVLHLHQAQFTWQSWVQQPHTQFWPELWVQAEDIPYSVPWTSTHYFVPEPPSWWVFGPVTGLFVSGPMFLTDLVSGSDAWFTFSWGNQSQFFAQIWQEISLFL